MPPSSEGSHPVRTIGFIGGVAAAAALLLFADLDPANPLVTRTAAVALWMAIWWITEAVPLSVTALLPVVLMPALGIQDGKEVSKAYFNWIVFLFLGGFLVAAAMQRWNLHRRIALRVLLMCGARPLRVLLGFMGVSAFLSMWISNTATAMMMVPIAMAVVLRLEDLVGAGRVARYGAGLLLGIAYSTSIGGIATLVGTPPNMVLAGLLDTQFPDAPEVSFAKWMLFGVPVALVLFAGLAVYLALVFRPSGDGVAIEKDDLHRQLRELGPMTMEEKVVLVDFTALALLWMTRAGFEFNSFKLPGWGSLFPRSEFLNDGSVAIGMALLLFFIPTRRDGATRILDANAIGELPWGIVLLFGGGFALASGFEASGLSQWVGAQLSGLGALHPFVLVLLVCLVVTFLTELTSNTASAQILLPVLANLAIAINLHPLLLMVAGTISCSCAFMLPVATPPNAIIFGAGRVAIGQMARVGLLLNLFGAVVIAVAAYFLVPAVLGFDALQTPAWAR